jgi:hypothetical protein
MAQRVNVVLVDDLDGSEAAETVNFGLDGANYEIDLSAENATKIREVLAVYVGHGRRTGGRRKGGAQGSGTAARSGGVASGPSASEIRAWARENGFDVPERGRVSSEVREAFLAAQ